MDKVNQAKKGFQPDSDVHVTLEDQQKINNFAKYNAKLHDIQAELTAKRSELKNLEDASEELILMEDGDETSLPFLYGEIFICLNFSSAQKNLKDEKRKVTNEIAELEEASEELKSHMNTLRTQLYAKFGNHINLGQ